MPVLAAHMPRLLARVAFELFAQRGFKSVTLDEVAARAGVTKGSLYHHYQSKKEIILAACEHYYGEWRRRISGAVAELADPMQRLRAALELSTRICLIDRRNRVFTAELFAASLSDADLRRGWAQFYDTVRETYIALVDAARAAGALSVDDPRRAVDLMLATMEGIKQRAAFEPECCAEEEQEAIVNEFLARLGAGAGPRRRPAAPKKRAAVRA